MPGRVELRSTRSTIAFQNKHEGEPESAYKLYVGLLWHEFHSQLAQLCSDPTLNHLTTHHELLLPAAHPPSAGQNLAFERTDQASLLHSLCHRRRIEEYLQVSNTMDQTTLRGSRAYVPKPGHYLFDKIRQEHTGICSSDRTREWVNNVPDIKGRRQPEKRRVLQELHNNRVSRQRTITPRSMATRPTSAAQSKNKGKYKEGEQLKRPEENPGYVHSQRSTRSTKRHTTALENVKEGSGDEDPLLEKSHDHSPTDLAVPMLSSISLDTVSELIYHSKSKRSSSPPKISTTSRGSSPSKGITTERLALYVPRIKFTGYFEQARKPHLLTEPVRTLWKEFIRPCGEDSSSIPIQLKVNSSPA